MKSKEKYFVFVLLDRRDGFTTYKNQYRLIIADPKRIGFCYYKTIRWNLNKKLSLHFIERLISSDQELHLVRKWTSEGDLLIESSDIEKVKNRLIELFNTNFINYYSV